MTSTKVEQMQKEVDAGFSHQLKFLMGKASVSIEAQHKVLKFGIKNTQAFACIEDDKKSVRALLRDDIKITDVLDVGLLVSV